MAEIVVDTNTSLDIPVADVSIMNIDPIVDPQTFTVANDTYNTTAESYTELEAYNGYSKRLTDGEEIADRIYDKDYVAETEDYCTEETEITMCVGEIIAPEVFAGSELKAMTITKDLPSLIFTVDNEEDQEFICIVDSNRVKALKPGTGKVHIHNTSNEFEVVITVTVVEGPEGRSFEIHV